MRPPPDFPSSPYPLLPGGGLTRAAKENPVVGLAAEYLGVPYRWGGARPKTGFDCSGLVQYVLAQLGVAIPHYAAAQYYSPETAWIPPEELQPGDLVFFTGPDGTRKAPGHVGIYIGDGYLIDAPHTGASVEIDSLDERWFANKYVGATRIVAPLRARPLVQDRHLLHSTSRVVSVADAPALALLVPRVLSTPSWLPRVPAAASARPQAYGYWTDGGLAGLLLLVGGGIGHRRRRTLENQAKAPD